MTRKFTPAREENGHFHLGRVLLRSARSIADGMALVLQDDVRGVTAKDPQTVATSSG